MACQRTSDHVADLEGQVDSVSGLTRPIIHVVLNPTLKIHIVTVIIPIIGGGFLSPCGVSLQVPLKSGVGRLGP